MKFSGKIALLAAVSIIAASAASAEKAPREKESRPDQTVEVVVERALARFDAADTDANGELSREEVSALREGMRGKPRREGDKSAERAPLTREKVLTDATERFESADANSDGILSMEEMRAAKPQMGRPGSRDGKEPRADHPEGDGARHRDGANRDHGGGKRGHDGPKTPASE